MSKLNKDQKVLEAIKTLIEWIGENPNREGLLETPQRVLKSFAEHFSGYKLSPESILSKTFTEISDYNDIILLKNIEVESHCEHHIAPISGFAHIAYIPNKKVVGISKISRVVEVFSKRLQIQERLTSEIAEAIYKSLEPKGVAVVINAEHHCLTRRGVYHNKTSFLTNVFLGCFKDDSKLKEEFWQLVNSK